MLKILILADNPLVNSGYAVTLREVADAFLEAGCQVEQIAFGLYEQADYKYKLHPVKQGDFFGKTTFAKVIDEYLPHIVFTFHDLHNISWIGAYPNRWFKWVAYFPLDSENLTVAQKHIISQIDQPIVYSKSAMRMVVYDCKREDVKIIYHGIDTNKFKTFDTEEMKRKYRMDGKFIVGSVGRNNTRKNFPALMESFAEFSKDKDDVMLYLHTQPVDGHNLYEYIKLFDLHNKVYFTKDMDMVGVTDEQLVELYSSFDVYVSTTQGEGLGLPLLEAQACGTPVLVTDYSACKEFVPKDNRIALSGHFFEGFWDTKRAIVDQKDLVAKLNKLYYNQDILPIMGEKGRKFVEGYDWKNIRPLWIYFIKLYAEQQFDIRVENQNALTKFIRI